MTRFKAIILAAGLSSRMGAFKPLLPLGDTTVLEHVANTFRRAEITPLVVGGHNFNALKALADKIGVEAEYNPHFEQGMFTSVKAGFARMAGHNYDGVFLLPIDIPLVRLSTLTLLKNDFNANHAAYDVWQPVFRLHNGHPPLLKQNLAQKITALPNHSNLHEVLCGVETGRKRKVNVFDRLILRDMDYKHEYERLKAEYALRDILHPSEAYAMLLQFRGDNPKLVRHSLKVMQVALRLALALKRKNVNINVRLVQSGALLHDIGKGEPEHAYYAAELLRNLDLPRMGRIAGCHSGFALSRGLCQNLGQDALAAKVVFIADKFVGSNSGDTLVTVNERFNNARARFGKNAEALQRINSLHNEARNVCAELSALLGQPIEKAVFGDCDA